LILLHLFFQKLKNRTFSTVSPVYLNFSGFELFPIIAILESDKVSETYTIYAHFGEKVGQFAATKYSVYFSLGFYPPEATSFLPVRKRLTVTNYLRVTHKIIGVPKIRRLITQPRRSTKHFLFRLNSVSTFLGQHHLHSFNKKADLLLILSLFLQRAVKVSTWRL
jgi:hypothetical protein